MAISSTFAAVPAFSQCAPGSPLVDNYEAPGASAPALRSTAVGISAQATCENSIAIGYGAFTSGNPGGALAIGVLASSEAVGSIAFGNSSVVTAREGVALGNGTSISGERSIALGSLAGASFDDSTAIGYGAQTTAANQMMFGTASTTYTMPGLATGGAPLFLTVDANGNLAAAGAPGGGPAVTVVDNLTTANPSAALSANQGVILAGLTSTAQGVAAAALSASTTAQTAAGAASTAANAAQATATAAQGTASTALQTANGALQRTGGTMSGSINMGGHTVTNVGDPIDPADAANKAYVDGQVGGLAGRVGNLESDISALNDRDAELAEGIAVSMAVAAPTFLPGQTFALRVGWGDFDGTHAVGISAAGVLAKGTLGSGSSLMVDGGIGTGTGRSVTAGRAGLTVGW